MPKSLAIYTDLAPDVQATLNDVADRIRERLQLTIKNIIEIGLDLNTVKKELGHGRFTPWIETEFGMSDQTARNFMNVATRFPKSKSLLDLKITKEALYLLAAPATDGEVVEVAMEKAEAGDKVGKAEVDAIKKELKKEKDENRDLRSTKELILENHERLHNIDLAQRDRILELEHELENTQKKPDQSELEATGEIPQLDKTMGTDGKARPAKRVVEVGADLGADDDDLIEEDDDGHLVPSEALPSRRMKSRPARWADAASQAVTALEELQEIQSEYQDWMDTLPENLRESAVAEKLESVTALDFDSAIETAREAENADLPLGFGRD